MINQEKFPLGQLLIEKGIITQEQLNQALEKQKETGDLLGAILLGMGFVSEETVFLPILAGQMGVDFVDAIFPDPYLVTAVCLDLSTVIITDETHRIHVVPKSGVNGSKTDTVIIELKLTAYMQIECRFVIHFGSGTANKLR